MAQWRKVMLIGSFILLATAIGNGIMKGDMPTWLRFLGSGTGFALLAVGFSLAARERNERVDSGDAPRE